MVDREDWVKDAKGEGMSRYEDGRHLDDVPMGTTTGAAMAAGWLRAFEKDLHRIALVVWQEVTAGRCEIDPDTHKALNRVAWIKRWPGAIDPRIYTGGDTDYGEVRNSLAG